MSLISKIKEIVICKLFVQCMESRRREQTTARGKACGDASWIISGALQILKIFFSRWPLIGFTAKKNTLEIIGHITLEFTCLKSKHSKIMLWSFKCTTTSKTRVLWLTYLYPCCSCFERLRITNYSFSARAGQIVSLPNKNLSHDVQYMCTSSVHKYGFGVFWK